MGYVVSFIVISYIIGRKWMSSLPQGKNLGGKKMKNLTLEEKKDLKENRMQIYEEWSREQTFSSTLAGFSLSAVTFILAFDNINEVTGTVGFFAFAFVFEMLSFLSYKYMVANVHEYLGTLFQFAGLLALLNGLIVFIFYHVGLTSIITGAFIVGYIGFFYLTINQLKSYFNIMKTFGKNKSLS
jgi:hypothetical protein